ncbi:MAG: terminase small subunit [Verrucomicrobia bacterium]|nr:terminase small subunit [Verrucomicrobiota bacterium]
MKNQIPHYVAKDKLAEAFSVSLRTIDRWMTYGCPFRKIGGNGVGRNVRFVLEEVATWLSSLQKGGI